jgi:phage tail-like protein
MPGGFGIASLVGNVVANARGTRRLTDKYGFRLESPLLKNDVAFVTGSELKITTEVIRYRAGGSLVPIKNPGLSDHDPYTVTRAATTGVHDLLAWKNLVVFSAMGGTARQGSPTGRAIGCEGSQYKCYIDIVQTNRCHQSIKRWRIFNAWPSEFSGIDGNDNNASEHVVESMTWEYDFFLLTDASGTNDISLRVLGGVLGGSGLQATVVGDISFPTRGPNPL